MLYFLYMEYDISDFQEIWRKGDGEMPDKVKHVVNAARNELKRMEMLSKIPDKPVFTLEEIRQAVEYVAPNYKVKQVQLFGSYADGVATGKSDIDMLVEFSERPITLWDFCGFQQALSDYLNTKVDIVKLPLSKEAAEDMSIQKVVQLYG